MSDDEKQRWQTLPAIIGGLAALVTALTGLLVALNQSGVFKQAGKKLAPTEEPVTGVTAAKSVKSADDTKPSTGAPSPMATVAQERARDYESAIAYNKSGIKKAEMGDFAGTLADYNRAIELDSTFLEAYNYRAAARDSVGDLTGALADCSRAIEINPNYFLAYSNRGRVRYEIRDFRAAAHDFRRASEINPKADYPHQWVWLSEMHLGQRERSDRQLADYFGNRIKAPGRDGTARAAAFLLNQLTLEEFLPRESPSDRTNAASRSEALFFAGMKCLFTGDKNGAARHLRTSVEIGRFAPEVRLAKAELKALG